MTGERHRRVFVGGIRGEVIGVSPNKNPCLAKDRLLDILGA